MLTGLLSAEENIAGQEELLSMHRSKGEKTQMARATRGRPNCDALECAVAAACRGWGIRH